MEVSINTFSTQDLTDRLHTAITEQDLIFTHYWIKELEARGEEGREAIRCGRHSWKRAMVMHGLLRSTKSTFEGGGKVRKIIFWMLDSHSARLIEDWDDIKRPEILREEWLELRANSQKENRQAQWLLKSDSHDIGCWIDENHLRPDDVSIFTGLNPLPPPPPPPLPLPLPPASHSPVVPSKRNFSASQSRVVESSSSEPEPSPPKRIKTLPPPNSPSPPPSPALDCLPESSVEPDVLEPPYLSRALPPTSSSHHVRLYPFPHQPQAQQNFLRMIREGTRFSEEPQCYEVQRVKSLSRGIVTGSLILGFETREGAKSAVEELTWNFGREINIELKSDHESFLRNSSASISNQAPPLTPALLFQESIRKLSTSPITSRSSSTSSSFSTATLPSAPLGQSSLVPKSTILPFIPKMIHHHGRKPSLGPQGVTPKDRGGR
ncbi:hypothetical protein JCM3765_002503 [Sporobolomyces pararoseus]